MKIDLCLPSLRVGGSERQLVGLAIALQEAGQDVRVITTNSGGPLAVALLDAGVPLVYVGDAGSCNPPGRLATAVKGVARLYGLWHRDRPDAVQAWLPAAQVIALPLAAIMRIPVRVMSVRSMSGPVKFTRASRLAVRLAARSSTAIFSNALASLQDAGWPLGCKPSYVVPNGVAIPQERSRGIRELSQAIVVANLTSIKGHDLLLDALSLTTSPDRILLVGDGPERTRLEDRVSKVGLEGRVTFLGSSEVVLDHLLASDFLIHPSPSEGSPNAVLEAMAAGLPIVALRVGGIPEIVQHGQTGILVPADRPRLLAEAVEWVAENREWRRLAGERARSAMQARSWERAAELNLKLMSEQLHPASGASADLD